MLILIVLFLKKCFIAKTTIYVCTSCWGLLSTVSCWSLFGRNNSYIYKAQNLHLFKTLPGTVCSTQALQDAGEDGGMLWSSLGNARDWCFCARWLLGTFSILLPITWHQNNHLHCFPSVQLKGNSGRMAICGGCYYTSRQILATESMLASCSLPYTAPAHSFPSTSSSFPSTPLFQPCAVSWSSLLSSPLDPSPLLIS